MTFKMCNMVSDRYMPQQTFLLSKTVLTALSQDHSLILILGIGEKGGWKLRFKNFSEFRGQSQEKVLLDFLILWHLFGCSLQYESS